MHVDISLFHGSYDSAPARTVPLEAALVAIQTGVYRAAIARLRRRRATSGEAAYTKGKASLDAFTPGGTFTPTRRKANLLHHSGMAHGDLDHLPDVQAVKQALCANPYIAYCFTSPSASGLKVGVRIPRVTDDETYKRYWQALAEYSQRRYGLMWDPSGKDICRLCYMSWDPELYYNPEALVWKTASASAPPSSPRPANAGPAGDGGEADRRRRYGQQALETAIRMLDASTDGSRHGIRRKVGYLIGGYIAGGMLSDARALAVLEPVVQRNTRHFTPSWKTVTACIAAGKADAISFEDLERERHAWLKAHGYHTFPEKSGAPSRIMVEVA